MTRPRKQSYRSGEIAELTRQLLYAPPEKRIEVVERAEQLHDGLDPEKNYPIDFVVYRLTNRRVPPSESVMLVGEAIRPDLRLLIDGLSRSVEMEAGASDPGMTIRELAGSLDVSTKTISRWRNTGLRWRWGLRGDKKVVLITQSALAAFEATQASRIAKASAFQRMSAREKEKLIDRARRLAQASDRPPQVILHHLAKRSGRSVEALRQMTLQHDDSYPEQAIFADRTGPLTAEQKSQIDRDYQQGVTVSALCERLGKTRSTIYRAIHEARAQRIKSQEIDFIYSPVFDRNDADEVLMQPIARHDSPRQLSMQVTNATPQSLRAIYDRPIESDDVVRSLIVRYNYLKFCASQLRDQIIASPPKASEMNTYDHLLGRIAQARGDVMGAVIPLALSVVRRQQSGRERGSEAALVRMLYTAHRVLIATIDRYDASVAHTFESVLANRLMRELAKPQSIQQLVTASDLIAQLADAGFQSDQD